MIINYSSYFCTKLSGHFLLLCSNTAVCVCGFVSDLFPSVNISGAWQQALTFDLCVTVPKEVSGVSSPLHLRRSLTLLCCCFDSRCKPESDQRSYRFFKKTEIKQGCCRFPLDTRVMSDQLEEEVERELYKHVGCKMFHNAGETTHM